MENQSSKGTFILPQTGIYMGIFNVLILGEEGKATLGMQEEIWTEDASFR